MAVPTYRQTMYVPTYADLPAMAADQQLAFVFDTGTSYLYNSSTSSWQPLGRLVVKRSTVVVDGKAVAKTPIYTLEQAGGMSFYPTQIVIRGANISGTTIKPTISVGSNSPNFDNIASGSLLNTVTSLLGITSQPLNVSTSPALPAGTVIQANVSIAAVATSYTFSVDIIGYYA